MEDNENEEPTFSMSDFKKWLSKNRKQERKNQLKEQFKEKFKKKIKDQSSEGSESP